MCTTCPTWANVQLNVADHITREGVRFSCAYLSGRRTEKDYLNREVRQDLILSTGPGAYCGNKGCTFVYKSSAVMRARCVSIKIGRAAPA